MGHIEADKSTKEKETKAATTTMVYPVSASNCWCFGGNTFRDRENC